MSADLPSAQASKPLTPEVAWAQRSSKDDTTKNFIWLTILASDVDDKKMKLDVQPTHVSFSGYSTSKKANYEIKMDFYEEVDPKESKIHHSARAVEMKLQKKDLKEEFWPRLLKDSKKQHYLKTDFDKWVDEDEQDGVADDDYMNQFGGAGGGGMPGMGADGGFGGLDFSKLGGAGGMAGMPDMGDMGDMGGEGDDDDDEDDDEEMPGLEEDENASPKGKAPAGAGKGKIEEVE